MTKIAGSGSRIRIRIQTGSKSGSISQRHGSADPDLTQTLTVRYTLCGIHLHGMLEHSDQYWGSGRKHELMTLEPFRALHHNPGVFTVFTCMAASTGDLAASMN